MKTALSTLEETLEVRKELLPTKCKTPLPHKCHPEIDTSSELDLDDTRLCQKLVGIFRWAVELSRIDIQFEVSLHSSHMANPRISHFNNILHIFGFLKRSPKVTIDFDPRYPKLYGIQKKYIYIYYNI